MRREFVTDWIHSINTLLAAFAIFTWISSRFPSLFDFRRVWGNVFPAKFADNHRWRETRRKRSWSLTCSFDIYEKTFLPFYCVFVFILPRQISSLLSGCSVRFDINHNGGKMEQKFSSLRLTVSFVLCGLERRMSCRFLWKLEWWSDVQNYYNKSSSRSFVKIFEIKLTHDIARSFYCCNAVRMNWKLKESCGKNLLK